MRRRITSSLILNMRITQRAVIFAAFAIQTQQPCARWAKRFLMTRTPPTCKDLLRQHYARHDHAHSKTAHRQGSI